MWANLEYVSNGAPTATSAPTGQMLTLALWLKETRRAHARRAKRNVDPGRRSTRSSRLRSPGRRRLVPHREGPRDPDVVGRPSSGAGPELRRHLRHAHAVTGVAARRARPRRRRRALCRPAWSRASPATARAASRPWGTVFTAEENVQDYYGDLEACWSSTNAFLAGAGFDPGAGGRPDVRARRPPSASSAAARLAAHAPRPRHATATSSRSIPAPRPGEYYGKTTPGVGHHKLGAIGRARWENVTFVTDARWKLVPGQPIVIYAGDDRRGGRIFKFVSAANYTAGMTKAQIRALLDDGALYVAHFAGLDNADGRRCSLASGRADGGDAGHRPVDRAVDDERRRRAQRDGARRRARRWATALQRRDLERHRRLPRRRRRAQGLFTACNKIGVMELNRPEDVEWNPLDPSGTPRSTSRSPTSTGGPALDQDGRASNNTTRARRRDRRDLRAAGGERGGPGAPRSTFTYFEVWAGTTGAGVFDARQPRQHRDRQRRRRLVRHRRQLRRERARRRALLPRPRPRPRGAGRPTARPSASRACPSDAEATGPCFASDMRTLFFSVQHPGRGHRDGQHRGRAEPVR